LVVGDPPKTLVEVGTGDNVQWRGPRDAGSVVQLFGPCTVRWADGNNGPCVARNMALVAVLVAVASSAVGAPASNGKRLVEWSVNGKRALPEWVTQDEIEQRMKVRVLVQHHLWHSLLLFLWRQ
jgi:hypothetical protein